MGTMKRKLVAAGVAVLAVAGAGAALGARVVGSPQEESQAVVNDAAKELGVQPSALTAALKKALENRIDAAVADGRLTKERGDALKQRIESGDLPLFAFPDHGPFGEHHGFLELEAAASYLGLSESELRTQLESGKTLADVAKARDKSVDGLVDALVAAAKERLDQAVADGRLSRDDETRILADLKQRITDRVNGNGPDFGFRGGFRFRERGGLPLAPPTGGPIF